ncbi:MAG: nuclear pore complex subunit [Odoribacter sp.]|nr:nuclear pore complex subunit [Odoribacter sp.]
MEKIIIQEPLKNCPGIIYFIDNNTLEISGRSIPENPELIFRRLHEWIAAHFDKNMSLSVNIFLEYINSGSSKYLYEILKKLTHYSRSDKEVTLKWLYEEDDEAMLELGEHYRDTAGIPLIIEMVV